MTAQCEWFAAADLAGLPGMPSAKRSVLLRAESGKWRSREVPSRGGVRLEFHISSLPAATRAALVWQRSNVIAGGQAVGAGVVAVSAAAVASQLGMATGQRRELAASLERRAIELAQAEGLRASMALDEKAQQRMDARLAVLRAVEAFGRASGISITAAEKQFVVAWRAGHAVVPATVRAVIGESLSACTLVRWRVAVRQGGISRLGGDYGNRKGATLVSSQAEVRAFVEAMLVQFPHARATQVRAGLAARMVAQIRGGELELPSVRTLERWIEQWRDQRKQTLAALENPDGWKNKYMVAFGSQSEGIDRINQRWEMDSTPGDVMLTDGRHTVLGVIDVFTRRARLLVAKTSKATAVCGLLRATLLGWGVPEIVKTDNGSDYVSKHVVRALKGLDVDHQLCPPFQPWHKPHIERFFGTFSRALLELLPGFIGHSVAERSAIEARTSFADRLMTRGQAVDVRMSSAEFQSFCDRWAADVYAHDAHEGLGRRTPFEVAAACREAVRGIADERVLDVLLAEAPVNDGRRTVQKQGIKHDDAWFIAPELEALVGQVIQVRFDPLDNDLGRLYVFGEEGFVCVAECPERTGMDRREVAIRAKAMQTKRVQEERRALRAAARKVGTADIVDEILTTRAEAAGKLSRLPSAIVPHESAGMAEAARAVAAVTAGPGSSADLLQLDGVSEVFARLQAEIAVVPAGNDNELARRRKVEAPQFDSRHARAQWLLQQQHVRAIDGEEREYLARYLKDHPGSYRRFADMAAEMHAQITDPSITSPKAAS